MVKQPAVFGDLELGSYLLTKAGETWKIVDIDEFDGTPLWGKDRAGILHQIRPMPADYPITMLVPTEAEAIATFQRVFGLGVDISIEDA